MIKVLFFSMMLFWSASCSKKSKPAEKPSLTKNCIRQTDEFLSNANDITLHPLELTEGEYDYMGGEVRVEVPLKQNNLFRLEVREWITPESDGVTFNRKMEVLCANSMDQLPENTELQIMAPRKIGVLPKSASFNAAIRGLHLKTIGSSVRYEFIDANEPKMGMTQKEYLNLFQSTFDSYQFIRHSLTDYEFRGKKKKSDGATLIIVIHYKKSGGNLKKDAFIPKPLPSLFKKP